MSPTTMQDRAAGALMGAFIGDALGLGPHWYYDLAALRRDYGEWITAYTDPQPDRYHGGLKAGELIQAIVPAIDGRGGGKPNLAQAGGSKAEGIPQALALASDWIKKKLA